MCIPFFTQKYPEQDFPHLEHIEEGASVQSGKTTNDALDNLEDLLAVRLEREQGGGE